MHRLTFKDVRSSRIPAVLGECAANTAALASYVNEAQQKLVEAGGDTGWYGTWAKMVFNVDPTLAMIVAPREVARLINMDVCRTPIRIQNEFYEFLEFGQGLQRGQPACGTTSCDLTINQAFDRGNVPYMGTFVAGNKLRLYYQNSADVGKRIFVSGTDSNSATIYTLDNGYQVNGFYMTIAAPFVDSPMTLNSITGIQKEVTLDPVSLFQVTAAGVQTLLSTYAPDETSPLYRSYFIQSLPSQCTDCDSPTGIVQVTAMAKLDFIPARNDTDPLIIQNLPALKEECMSIRFAEMDSKGAMEMSDYHHRMAIRHLNKQLIHYVGKEDVAIQFKPFGNATLQKAGVGMM